MALVIILPPYFSEDKYPVLKDVVKLVRTKNFAELSKTIVSCNKEGVPVIYFTDSEWNIRHYLIQTNIYKHTFSFTEFTIAPALETELKLIVYGWLFHKNSIRATPAKPSTLISRFLKLKLVYRYLLKNRYESIAVLLNSQKEWGKFEHYLSEFNYSQSSLHSLFTAINHVLAIQKWLEIPLTAIKIKSFTSGNKLSSLQSQQTLTIPERIADKILGSAVAMIEEAYKYSNDIAATEHALQENYLEGKAILDHKIKSGAVTWLADHKRKTNKSHRYAQEILKASPKTQRQIVHKHLQHANLKYLTDDIFFKRYYHLLITAGYICCGAFSGMRDSELSELTSDSYFREDFGGKTFHMLQSHTFKMGEKKTTWVTAPVSGKAIELVSILTAVWRQDFNNSSSRPSNVIWMGRISRSKPPAFSSWTQRLKNFCKHFNITITEEDYQECLSSNPNSIHKIHSIIKPGDLWPLSTHQFRRSLAFYMIKHQLGNTLALKQQFKHLYLQMTEWYTAGGIKARINDLHLDNSLQELLDSTRMEETTNKIFSFIHSNSTLSGSHGKAIVEMRQDIPHIYSSWEVIYDAVRNGLLTLHGTLHSYCKNGYNCDMEGVINPAFCVNCSSGGSIIDAEHANWWKIKHQSLIEYLLACPSVSSSVYSHCIIQIRAAESVMNDFGIEFSPYKHPVEIVEQ